MRIPKLSIKAILLCMAMVLLIEMLPASLNSREVTPLALAAVEPGRQNEPIGIEESKPGGGAGSRRPSSATQPS